VDPVSRRDFWRILYQLLRENVTIFVSTAYLDEAERCNRVGLMYRGRLLAAGRPGEVKRLMRGSILEIRSSAPRHATALLRERIPQGSVGLFGDRIHLVTHFPERDRAEAETVLAEAGLEIFGVRTIEPNLEDVFISVVSGASEEGPSRGNGNG
jgi:ABC-2 type transport system ATP-binding protein